LIVPRENKKDIDEIKKEIPPDVTFNFVKEMDEVLELALARPGKPRPTTKTIPGMDYPDKQLYA